LLFHCIIAFSAVHAQDSIRQTLPKIVIKDPFDTIKAIKIIDTKAGSVASADFFYIL
jgi:hypothetical protein